MSAIEKNVRWDSFYASDIYEWQQTTLDGRPICYRRLGLVENMFDTDGADFEGRADMNMNATIEIKTRLSDDELEYRVTLVWAYMRCLHPLLACKSLYREDFLPGTSGRRWIDKCFVYEKPLNRQQMLDSARLQMRVVGNSLSNFSRDDFYDHLMNTGRAIDEKKALSRLYVLPSRRTPAGTVTLDLIIVMAHQIADGLTIFRRVASLVNLLNTSEQALYSRMDALCSGDSVLVSMPLAQESLYPIYGTTTARARWNWAITRILRHVRKPPSASFQNPLRRDKPLKSPVKMPEKYPQVLNYSKTPPLNAFSVKADLSKRATDNLTKLCRQAGISVGSGAFTLVCIIMMRFEEARAPDIPYWERRPFVGSFPVNPRPFFSGLRTADGEDSLMLAFSDGVTLPFVPSDLDFIKTFRVLGRLAHRQLRQYQKRKRTPAEEVLLGSRSPRELIPALYLMVMQRLERMVKPEQRMGLNPQQAYPAAQSATPATCGISSVGDIRTLTASAHRNLDDDTNDVVATLRDMQSFVRARDDEFLVGAIGAQDGLQFRASYDGCAIDPAKVQAWKEAILSILDFNMDTDRNETLRAVLNTSERKSKL